MNSGIAPRRNNADLYVAAGLPRAEFSKQTVSPTVARLAFDAKIGTLVHEVLSQVVDVCQRLGLDHSGPLIDDAIRGVVLDRGMGRGDKARLMVAGRVAGYLTSWLPASPTGLLGAEVRVTQGRVDLAWSHPERGTFYDEVKTWRHDQKVVDSTALDQVEKYIDAGVKTYGTRFAGVRLITLGNRTAALWFRPDGLIEKLTGSVMDLTPCAINRQGGLVA